MSAYGTCQVCGTRRPVKADGTLRRHEDPTTGRVCQGSGWAPKREDS